MSNNGTVVKTVWNCCVYFCKMSARMRQKHAMQCTDCVACTHGWLREFIKWAALRTPWHHAISRSGYQRHTAL